MIHRGFRTAATAVAVTLTAVGAATVASSSASAAPSAAFTASTTSATPAGSYAGLEPARILDTRSGNGAPKGALGAGKTLTLQVTGRGGVPTTDVGSVVLNLTVTGPTSGSYLTAYPSGTTRPGSSSINFAKGWTGANLVTVKVGSGGRIALYNNAGSVNVIADVVGYYNGGATTRTGYGSYQEVQPERLLDSRSDGLGPLPGGSYATVGVDYGDAVNAHIKALAVNITAVRPSASGYLTAWDGASDVLPNTSSLNYATGSIVPNMQIVPVSPDEDGYPSIAIGNVSKGSTHILVDIVGFYDDDAIPNGDGFYAARYVPRASPTRIVDTRKGQGATTMTPSSETKVVVTPSSIAGSDTLALVTNTTAISPSASTFLTLWPNFTATAPGVSNLNPAAGQTVANMTITSVGFSNDFRMKNNAGTLNAAVDVAGTMEAYSAADPSAARTTRAFGASPDAPASARQLRRLASHHEATIGSAR